MTARKVTVFRPVSRPEYWMAAEFLRYNRTWNLVNPAYCELLSKFVQFLQHPPIRRKLSCTLLYCEFAPFFLLLLGVAPPAGVLDK